MADESPMNLIIRLILNAAGFASGIDEEKAKIDELDSQKIGDKKFNVDVDTEEAHAEIDKLRAMIHDENFNVNADTSEADAKLDFVKETLNSIKETTARIELSDPDANRELDSLKRKLDSMTRTTMMLTLDDPFVDEKLENLNRQIDQLKRKFTNIPVSVEDGSATEKIWAIKKDLDSLHDKTVNIDVDDHGAAEKIKADEEETRRLGGVIDSTSGSMGILGHAIMASLPLVAPLAAVATAGVMGIASGLAAASVGAIGFGAIAAPEITKVVSAANQGEAAIKKLDSAEQQAARSVQSFESFWNRLSASLEKPILGAFTNGIKALQAILTGLEPAIRGAANAINGLMRDLQRSIGTPPVQKFFDYLGHTAGPMITAFGKIAGNVLLGVMNLLRAFGPLGTQMVNSLVRMSAAFAQWSARITASKGFQQFVQYVQQNGPRVMSVIANIVSAVGHIVVALAPLGAAVLRVIQAMSQWLNNLTRLHPGLVQLAVGIMSGISAIRLMATAVSALLSPFRLLFSLVPAGVRQMVTEFMRTSIIPTLMRAIGVSFTFLTGPWGILIAAVVAGVILLITHFSQVSSWIHANFGISIPQILRTLSNVFKTVWDEIKEAVSSAWSYIEPTIMSGVRSIESFWDQAWPMIKEVFTEVWDAIKPIIQTVLALWQAEFQVFFSVLRAIWGPFWASLGSILKGVWDEITGVIRIAWDIIKGVILTGLDLLTGRWGAAWNEIKSTFSNVWNDIKSMMGNLIHDAFSFGSNFVHMIASGIRSAVGAVSSAVSSVAGKIKSFLGFHSPTEEGPGADADTWAPNFMKMFTQGITQYTPALQGALTKAITPPTTVTNPNIKGLVNSSLSGYSNNSTTAGSTNGYAVNGPLLHIDTLVVRNNQDIQKIQQSLYNADERVRRAKGVRGV